VRAHYGWMVIQTVDDQVHVLPAVDGRRHAAHTAAIECPCWPMALRDGPLDEPVWSHQQPGWPGETTRRRAN